MKKFTAIVVVHIILFTLIFTLPSNKAEAFTDSYKLYFVADTSAAPDQNAVLNPDASVSDSTDIDLRAVSQPESVTLDWAKISKKGVVGYYVYRTKSPGEYLLPITDFPIVGTTYIDKSAEQSNIYYYIVKAVYSDGSESKASNEVSASIQTVKPAQSAIILQPGNPNMLVDNISREIDPGKGTAPILTGDRTLVPIRAIIEAMGGTLGWEGAEQKITITLKDKKLDMWIGKKVLKINGQEKEMDASPQIINERTMLPLRFVTENLGCSVQWEGTTKKITIYFTAQ